jgi:hypothetical protein
MVGEKRFFDTLGSDVQTIIPGGADVQGELMLEDDRHILDYFNSKCIAMEDDGTAASGTRGATNVINTGTTNMEMYVHTVATGGAQTIVCPQLVADGLDVELDGADNEGAEYCWGILTSNKSVFKVGTDPAFFARLKFEIDDVTDFDDCAFGFRKAEAYQQAIDSYDEMACLNVISGNINIETILNNDTTATTDTTDDWDDGEVHELKVLVSAAGVVTYQIDGAPPTTTAAFTFDDDEYVTPFFFFMHATGAATGLIWKEFECGYQQ